MTTKVEKSVTVDVPVDMAYNQWTQFEEFPHFMEGIESVKQLDDTHLHWRAKVAGKTEEWDAVITEQVPDQKVAWKSTSGRENAGVVTFNRLGENQTRVTVQMDYDPEGVVENVGDALGFVDRRVQSDLNRFKKCIEDMGHETGGWRGTVEQSHTR